MKKIKLICFSLIGIVLASCDGFRFPLQSELEKGLGLNKKTNYDLLIAAGAAAMAGGEEQPTQEEMFDVSFMPGDSYGVGYSDAITAPWYEETAYPNLIVKQALPNNTDKWLVFNQYYLGADVYEIPYLVPGYSDKTACEIEMEISGGSTPHNPDELGIDCDSVLLADAVGIMIKPAPDDARSLNWSVEGHTFTDFLNTSGVCQYKYGIDKNDASDDCYGGAPIADAQLAGNYSTLTPMEKLEEVNPTFFNGSTAGNHVLCAALAINNDCITEGVGNDIWGRTPEQTFLEDSSEFFERASALESVKGGMIWNIPPVYVLPYLTKWDDEVDYSAKCEDVQPVEIATVCYDRNGAVTDCSRTGGGGSSNTQSDLDGDTISDDTDACDYPDGAGNPADSGCLDTDGDLVLDHSDNCVNDSNVGQEDLDADGQGDACDTDDDDDTVADTSDNCVLVSNTTQTNSETLAKRDSFGDACDLDDVNKDDGSGTFSDLDGDAVSDSTDSCDYPDGSGNPVNSGCLDTDGDSVLDHSDNCVNDSNVGQEDLDTDGQGDACDTDDDGDETLDTSDICSMVADVQTDTDSDGFGDACDTDPATADPDAGSTSGSFDSNDVGQSCGDSSDTYGVTLAGVEGCNYSTLDGTVSRVCTNKAGQEVTCSDTDTYTKATTVTYSCTPDTDTVTPTGANRGDEYTGRTGFYITDVDSADIILDKNEQNQILEFTDIINNHLLDLTIQYNVAYADFVTMLGEIIINGGRPIVNPNTGEIDAYAQLDWPLPNNADGSANAGCFSYLGIHLTRYCQVVIANELMKSINGTYGLNIELIDEWGAYQADYYNQNPFDIEAYLEEYGLGMLISAGINFAF